MFGHRYFAGRYYPPRYFPPASDGGPVTHEGCALLLEDGGYLLQEDGVYHLLLEQCPEVPATPSGHGAGGPSAWYYKKLAERRRRLRNEAYQRKLAIRYAERLADALQQAEAEDAEYLAASVERLEQILANSQAYLTAYLDKLVLVANEAARLAAKDAENARVEAAMREAAEIARRIEEELNDEEEAILLLLLN